MGCAGDQPGFKQAQEEQSSAGMARGQELPGPALLRHTRGKPALNVVFEENVD